jgi:8-amino-7-oxononanoate synthase
MLDFLHADLEKRKTLGLTRQRRLLDSPQAEHITANGQRFLSFCSNDYLGWPMTLRWWPPCNTQRPRPA